jgi:hypothetical protein
MTWHFLARGWGVILPFCKGCGSRNVKRPWPAAAWVWTRPRPCLGVFACYRNDFCKCIPVCALHLHHFPLLQCLAWIIRRNLFRVAPVSTCVMRVTHRLLMSRRMGVWQVGYSGATKNPHPARECGFNVQTTSVRNSMFCSRSWSFEVV